MPKVICTCLALLLAVATQSLAQQPGIEIAGEDSAPSLSTPDGYSTSNDMVDMSASKMGAEHGHSARPVDPGLPIPQLSHLMFPDAMDGYNVQILAKNFRFTPASINREVVANEGHAHIYINGEKIARIYGDWYHLPFSLFNAGVNVVTVTLNANDHSTWATENGSLIASSVPVIRPNSIDDDK